MPRFQIDNLESKETWEVTVDAERFFVGRSQRSEVRLKHGSISRQHLLLERQGDVYHFVDLCSTNGTLVNDTRHRQGPLANGDVLRLGVFRLRFTLEEPAATPEPPTARKTVETSRHARTKPPQTPPRSAPKIPAGVAANSVRVGTAASERALNWTLALVAVLLSVCVALGAFLAHLGSLLD